MCFSLSKFFFLFEFQIMLGVSELCWSHGPQATIFSFKYNNAAYIARVNAWIPQLDKVAKNDMLLHAIDILPKEKSTLTYVQLPDQAMLHCLQTKGIDFMWIATDALLIEWTSKATTKTRIIVASSHGCHTDPFIANEVAWHGIALHCTNQYKISLRHPSIPKDIEIEITHVNPASLVHWDEERGDSGSLSIYHEDKENNSSHFILAKIPKPRSDDESQNLIYDILRKALRSESYKFPYRYKDQDFNVCRYDMFNGE